MCPGEWAPSTFGARICRASSRLEYAISRFDGLDLVVHGETRAGRQRGELSGVASSRNAYFIATTFKDAKSDGAMELFPINMGNIPGRPSGPSLSWIEKLFVIERHSPSGKGPIIQRDDGGRAFVRKSPGKATSQQGDCWPLPGGGSLCRDRLLCQFPGPC